ncbi:MAG: glutamate--tRNA ligase family protein [Microthrixaceae bacterium]
MTTPLRMRFAPSPTGYLHLGSARAALFNWLHARHLAATGHDAEFLLRIEDTDLDRSSPEMVAVVLDVLSWLGIDHDGEVVYQSRRRDRHDEAITALLASGAAYRCDCAPEAVKARNAEAGGPPGYDGFCRDRDVSVDDPHVVRFRAPDVGETTWDDLIRGPITVAHRTIEDFVLRRSDGSPVFLVANAVDDAEMGITHVIRGEDLINVTPKVLLLRRARFRGDAGLRPHALDRQRAGQEALQAA